MTDERVDALIRRLDVRSSPDPAFVRVTAALLLPRVRAARVQDLSRLGRLRRDLCVVAAPALRVSVPRPMAIVGLLVLLLLTALALAFVIAGAFNHTFLAGNGPLIVAAGGEIRAIDVDSGSSRSIAPPATSAQHVSRSPDGRLVAYWKVGLYGDQLMFMGIDGQGRRPVAQGPAMSWAGCVDTWSPDSHYVASEVTVDGSARILVADASTGAGRLVLPDGVIGHCPLWSPDSAWIAFDEDLSSGRSILAVMRADGADLHGVSGDIGSADVAGANSWSEDGTWIYFTTGGSSGSIWRANVSLGMSTRLTDRPGFATAVAASPDGRLISWIVSVSTTVGWDLYVAKSDGTEPHLLLKDALSLGWSADGRWILARWEPVDGTGGIALVAPDGTAVRVVVPANESCVDPAQVCDVGWGQARP